MTSCPELLRPVLDAPHDYARRMVYADWCEENGFPDLAWFVRHQVTSGGVCLLRAGEAVRVRGSVLYECPVPGLEDAGGFTYTVRGGFIEEVACRHCGDWLAVGPGVAKANPVVRVWWPGLEPADAGLTVGGYTTLAWPGRPALVRHPSWEFRPWAGWGWPPPPGSLPLAAYAFLPGPAGPGVAAVADAGGGEARVARRGYPTRELALAAAAEALVAWARSA